MKDRSFAHRIYQSNIDRQRNAAYFMAHVDRQAPAPKADYWQRVKSFTVDLFEGPFFWIAMGMACGAIAGTIIKALSQ